MSANEIVHVAVGVVVNAANEVLVSLRDIASHQGGLWEFPGGKVEPGEDVVSALKREFAEELGLCIRQCFPLKKIQHHYSDKSVLLDIWQITDFDGEARGLEGQAVEWRPIGNLLDVEFPAANAAIIQTLKLPPEIGITPDVQSIEEMESVIEQFLQAELQVVQFRQTQLGGQQYLQWFDRALELCASRPTRLLMNQDLELFGHLTNPLNPLAVESSQAASAGYHANSRRLLRLQERPVAQGTLFSASCHNLQELVHAQALDADFVFLSPLAQTKKVGSNLGMGWDKFQTLSSQVHLPVYALGGLARPDLEEARRRGGAGIAGISAYLK